jgi:hypothetical protein
MNDFKLKMILTVLSGIVFSFIFIVLAFVLPVRESTIFYKQPTNKLGEVAKSFRER